MRRADIDFVHPRWSPGLVILGAFVAIAVVLTSSMFWLHRVQERSLQAELQRLQGLKTAATEPVAQKPKAPPPWLQEAQTSLVHDWNAQFSHLEVTSVEGTRLLSVEAGVHPPGVRVEFELDGWLRVSEVNEALNQDPDRGRWNLLSVSPSTGGNVAAGPVRAVWTR